MGVAAGAVKQLLELHCPAAGRSRGRGWTAEATDTRPPPHAAGIATATARGPATRRTTHPPHPGEQALAGASSPSRQTMCRAFYRGNTLRVQLSLNKHTPDWSKNGWGVAFLFDYTMMTHLDILIFSNYHIFNSNVNVLMFDWKSKAAVGWKLTNFSKNYLLAKIRLFCNVLQSLSPQTLQIRTCPPYNFLI